MSFARAWLVAMALAAGCDGGVAAAHCSIMCSAQSTCPSGMACAPDGYCHLEGDATDCTPAQPPDARELPPEPACPRCDQPPSSCPSECETLVYETSGECLDGQCVYDPVVAVGCPYGCDPATGACRAEAEACGQTLCEADVFCGGTCRIGCCVREQYQKTSGNVACCDGTDPRLDIADCGDGQNHWVEVSGANCGVGREGPANYGSPCVRLTCERIVCPIP